MSGETVLLPCTVLEESEKELRDAVRRFAKDVISPRVAEMESKQALDPTVLEGLFELGFMGISIDEKYGGSGLSLFHDCLAIEELSKVDPSVAVMVDIQNTIVNTSLQKWGTENQKEKWLPQLATTLASSFCLSETSSGSDAFALKTRAEKRDDYYVLNGEKSWISNAREAGVFLIFANADPTKGYKGVTCFIVPRDTEGLSVGPPEKKLGIRASSTCPVALDDVKVPADAILGGPGRGYKIAIDVLNEGRIGIAAQMIGLAQGTLDVALPYLDDRIQFGRPISQFQAIQFQIAQAVTDLQAAKTLTYNVARAASAPRHPTHDGFHDRHDYNALVKEAAMAKLFTAQVAERIASRCVDWLGGVGFTDAYTVEKFYRDVKIGAIYEGTSNIQLMTVAKYLAKQHSDSIYAFNQ